MNLHHSFLNSIPTVKADHLNTTSKLLPQLSVQSWCHGVHYFKIQSQELSIHWRYALSMTHQLRQNFSFETLLRQRGSPAPPVFFFFFVITPTNLMNVSRCASVFLNSTLYNLHQLQSDYNWKPPLQKYQPGPHMSNTLLKHNNNFIKAFISLTAIETR